MHPEHRAQNKTSRYRPMDDLRKRWPGWRIVRRVLPHAVEVIRPREKLILIDADHFNEDPGLHLAHAIAHLDLHLDQMPAWFSDAQCQDADFYAELRLDREDDRDAALEDLSVDGPPTLTH